MKLTAAVLLTLLSLGTQTALAATSPKTYAVFLATLDPQTGQATGGVAGSAFFVSPKQAITAFHVLQPKSFENPNTQIWLVHENEPAIELKREELTSDATLDRTTINLSTARAPQRHVFKRSAEGASEAQPLAVGTKVETEGFVANSTGPILEFTNVKPMTSTLPSTSTSTSKRPLLPRLHITAVPHLTRLHSEGSILQNVRVELASQDVNLRNAPCVQVSYKPVVGLSGGPVFAGNRVIGMNSFADPQARASTWAIDISTN